MGTGAITGYIDVAQIVLYIFWIFFFGLVYYLQMEGKREGYPLETVRPSGETEYDPGFVMRPTPKTFMLEHGGEVSYPNDTVSPQTLHAEPLYRYAGSPLVPTGNPMLDGVGPGAYADRADVPDAMWHGEAKIVPLRVAEGYGVAAKDVDPRGLPVLGADDEVAGTVVDLWIDKMEMMFRYLEVAVNVDGVQRNVLLPMNFSRINSERVKVRSIMSHQFARVPATRSPVQITMLEEEKVMAYFGAGTLYAEPSRQESMV
jgi:photosynthetic reaction center H subunit